MEDPGGLKITLLRDPSYSRYIRYLSTCPALVSSQFSIPERVIWVTGQYNGVLNQGQDSHVDVRQQDTFFVCPPYFLECIFSKHVQRCDACDKTIKCGHFLYGFVKWRALKTLLAVVMLSQLICRLAASYMMVMDKSKTLLPTSWMTHRHYYILMQVMTEYYI